VAGCASKTPGQSSPATTPGSSGSAAPASTGISLPPRPKTLSFAGIDPCKLLTAQQQAELNVNRVLPHKPAPPFNEPGCSYVVDAQKPNYTFVIIPLPKMGIQDLLGKVDPSTSKVFSAAGFPAVQSQVDVPFQSCFADVDTGQGQMLAIQLGLDTPRGLTMDEMCAKVQRSAELAVTTLRQLNG
jgi:hypothetical protein